MQPKNRWKVSNPEKEFGYEHELQTALAVLGRGSPTIPPPPGTAGFQKAKLEYIMAKKAYAEAVEEVVDVALIRQKINRWLGPDATDIQSEAALKAIPGIIAALVRALKTPAKDGEVGFDPSLD